MHITHRPTRRSPHPRATGLALLVFASCTGQTPDPWTGTVDTTATGVVVVTNPPNPRWAAEDAWRVEEVGRAGAVEGEGPEIFGRISFLSIDPLGRSWVYESQADEMRVFDRAGRWVRNVGRGGEGPGEFANPSGMAWDPEGRAWIMDPSAIRVSVFDTTGAFLDSYRMPGGAQRFPWPGTVDAQGRLWDQLGGLQDSWLVRFGPELASADSFPAPEDPLAEERFVTVTTETSRMSMGIPYAGSHRWRLTAGGDLWTLMGESYRLSRLTPEGDTLRRVTVAWEPVPVTAEERAAAVEQWSGSGDMGRLDPDLIPRNKPPVSSFVVDDQGYLWVARYPDDTGVRGGTDRFDILSPEGFHLGQVTLPWPVSTLTLDIRGDELAAVIWDDLGVPYLVRGRIRRGG